MLLFLFLRKKILTIKQLKGRIQSTWRGRPQELEVHVPVYKHGIRKDELVNACS